MNWAFSTGASRVVTHRTTGPARRSLTSPSGREGVRLSVIWPKTLVNDDLIVYIQVNWHFNVVMQTVTIYVSLQSCRCWGHYSNDSTHVNLYTHQFAKKAWRTDSVVTIVVSWYFRCTVALCQFNALVCNMPTCQHANISRGPNNTRTGIVE